MKPIIAVLTIWALAALLSCNKEDNVKKGARNTYHPEAPLSFGGTTIYKGVGNSFAIASLMNNLIHYVAIYAFDASGNYSTPALTKAVPKTMDTSVPFRIYLSPYGFDNNNGLTLFTALRTLAAAQIKLKYYKPVLDCDVEIRIKFIANTPFRGQHVLWTHVSSIYSISFMPYDYEYGDGYDDIAGRPVFDGGGDTNYFFRLRASSGQKTNLRFYYLQIQRYVSGGISFYGNKTNRLGWNGYNTVYGCYFRYLGNLHNPGVSKGYGAIQFVNSDYNLIQNNHFIQLENRSPDWSYIHGVYIAHNSEHNLVEANRFSSITGNPIAIRDLSNFNKVLSNKFIRTGLYAFISDWHAECECRSWENEFRNNTPLSCGYSGQRFDSVYGIKDLHCERPDCRTFVHRIYVDGNDPTLCP